MSLIRVPKLLLHALQDELFLTIVIFLRHGHRSQEVRRPSDGLALVLDEHLVHAHLLRREGSVAPVQVQVHLDRTGRTDDLGRDGVHVDLLVENVDLELALERERDH